MEESSSQFTWKEPRKLMTRSTRLKLETIFPQNKTFWHQHGDQKKERLADWQGHGDLSCSPVLICLQAPVLLLAEAQRWLLSVSSQRWLFSVSLSLGFCALSTLCLLYSDSPSPVMHIFCLRRGEWFVIEAGWGMYCWKRELILALSETVLVLLFHFVSICLCILVGPWVGGLA